MLKKMWTDPVWSKVIASIIFALLAGIASYVAGLWPSIPSLVRQVVSIDVPLWSFLFGVLLVFLTGFLIGRNRWRLWSRGGQAEIGFDYLPESPILHGWTVNAEEPPKFSTVDDGFLGKTLRIEPQGRYRLDYLLQAVSKVPHVTVLGRWTADSSVYLRVKLVSRSGQSNTTGWIHLGTAITAPKQTGDYSKGWYEWSLPVSLVFEDGWQQCTVDIEQAVRKTFGVAGWKYAHLEGYRVRGKFDLARITWKNALR